MSDHKAKNQQLHSLTQSEDPTQGQQIQRRADTFNLVAQRKQNAAWFTQMKAHGEGGTGSILEAAAQGVRGSGSSLPHMGAIQRLSPIYAGIQIGKNLTRRGSRDSDD